MKKYVVIERSRKPDYLEVVNKDTTSPNDIWYSVINIKNGINLDHRVLMFNTRNEAETYKKAQQNSYNEDWKKWGHYFKAMGQNKPKWVVMEYNSVFRTQTTQVG
jgi:hypothetical protein